MTLKRRCWTRLLSVLICSALFGDFAVICVGQQSLGETGDLSISGKVVDAATGTPISGATVWTRTQSSVVRGTTFVGKQSKKVLATTDTDGRYVLNDLTAGIYRVVSDGKYPPFTTQSREVELQSEVGATSIDFRSEAPGIIHGTVLDDEDSPLDGVDVILVAKEQFLGELRYSAKYITKTDHAGEYTLRTHPGRNYLLFATRRQRVLQTISEDPDDVEKREPVRESAFYGNLPFPEGAPSILLTPGEERFGVDIRLGITKNYCVQGRAEFGSNAKNPDLRIELVNPSFGMFAEGGLVVPGAKAALGPDGKFRICGLHPGGYWITATGRDGSSWLYDRQRLEISNEDVGDIQLYPHHGASLRANLRWAGSLEKSVLDKNRFEVSIGLRSLDSMSMLGEALSGRTTVPGSLDFRGLRLGMEYKVSVVPHSSRMYVRDILYGGISILHQALQFGGSPGEAVLDVILGHDSASISVRVLGDNGRAETDATVFVFPEAVASALQLGEQLISGPVSDAGIFNAESLAPGTWLILARDGGVNPGWESMELLWQSRRDATKVQIAPQESRQVVVTAIR